MKNNNILNIIKNRQSTRSSFDPNRSLRRESLDQILEAARWAPTPHNMQNFEIMVIDNKKILEKIGNIEYAISDEFIRENYQQLSFSKEEFLKKKVGLLGTMFPPALLRNPTLDKESREKVVSSIGRFIQSNPILLIILYDPTKRAPASKGDFLGIMGLGCVMENMWLMAESLGIAFHVITALSTDGVEQEIKTILNIPNQMKIAFSARLGYALSKTRKYLRVRREKEDFIYSNKYGKKYID
ncbi:MAG: nitroreductase family protein [Promethearchaeota archaeon]